MLKICQTVALAVFLTVEIIPVSAAAAEDELTAGFGRDVVVPFAFGCELIRDKKQNRPPKSPTAKTRPSIRRYQAPRIRVFACKTPAMNSHVLLPTPNIQQRLLSRIRIRLVRGEELLRRGSGVVAEPDLLDRATHALALAHAFEIVGISAASCVLE